MERRTANGDRGTAKRRVLRVNGIPIDDPVVIDHSPGCLSLERLIAVARGDDDGQVARVAISEDSLKRCERSARKVHEAIMRAQTEFESASPENRHLFLIYGVNTGFGINRDKPVWTFAECCKLSENILFSHATGVGRPLASEVVRATMLLRLRTFAQGRSGVRPQLLVLLAAMLNRRVHPVVPSQGSVGSSGDLCSLSHLSLVLIGEGMAWVEPEYPRPSCHSWDDTKDPRPAPIPGKEALEAVGLKPLEPLAIPNTSGPDRSLRLAPKEGISLTNGAAVSAAITALAVHDAEVLLDSANLAGAMTLQAIGGSTRAFEPNVQDARGHKGQQACAKRLMAFVSNPDRNGLDNRAAVFFQTQDDYCVRAMPPVHGAALSAVWHAREVIEAEINAVTDNPLVFCEPGDESFRPYDERVGRQISSWPVYSGANFHGEPIGLVADYLKIALAELASICERRVQMVLDADRNRGLPANLAGGQGGLNSGFMLFQYTAASLVSENKVLCHPASCDSIPTSSDAEDHVAMATTAARHLRKVVLNLANVLAIEFICAAQALLFRTSMGRALSIRDNGERRTANQKPTISPPCSAALDKVASVSPFVTDDDDFQKLLPHARIEAVRDLVMAGVLRRLAESEVKE